MRRIPPFLATTLVAIWVFAIGFAVGYENMLASDPMLTREPSDALAAGLWVGAGAVVVVAAVTVVIATGVRIAKALARARTREPAVVHQPAN